MIVRPAHAEFSYFDLKEPQRYTRRTSIEITNGRRRLRHVEDCSSKQMSSSTMAYWTAWLGVAEKVGHKYPSTQVRDPIELKRGLVPSP